MEWLTKTPMAVVAGHVEMMHRMQAEESMTATTEVALARALDPESWARRQWAAWSRASKASQGPSRPASPADLKSVGIGYRVHRG